MISVDVTSQVDFVLLFTMTEPILTVRDLAVYKARDDAIFSNISLDVHEGDVLVLQGRSGGG